MNFENALFFSQYISAGSLCIAAQNKLNLCVVCTFTSICVDNSSYANNSVCILFLMYTYTIRHITQIIVVQFKPLQAFKM